MFSTEQNGVDVAGVENWPLSRSPAMARGEDEADGGCNVARNCKGGGVAAAEEEGDEEARCNASRIEATAVGEEG